MVEYEVDIRAKYQKYIKVVEACKDAGIQKLPEETAKYFGCEHPEDVEMESPLVVKIPKKEWKDGSMTEGYEIKVSDIPEGVEVIRFCNSW